MVKYFPTEVVERVLLFLAGIVGSSSEPAVVCVLSWVADTTLEATSELCEAKMESHTKLWHVLYYLIFRRN